MTDFFSTNSFDLAVYLCLFVAVVMGFMTGLLRSLATIIGYICGAGIAVAATPKALFLLANYPKIPTPQTWIVVVAIFIVAEALISVVLRLIVSGVAGRNVSVPDRIGGHSVPFALPCWRSCWCLSSIASFRPVASLHFSGDRSGAQCCHRRHSTEYSRFHRKPKTISIA